MRAVGAQSGPIIAVGATPRCLMCIRGGFGGWAPRTRAGNVKGVTAKLTVQLVISKPAVLVKICGINLNVRLGIPKGVQTEALMGSLASHKPAPKRALK